MACGRTARGVDEKSGRRGDGLGAAEAGEERGRRGGGRAIVTAITLGAMWAVAAFGAAAAEANPGPASPCPTSGPDLVRGFCGGPARITVTVGSTVYHLNHGTCDVGGGYFGINAGTVSSPQPTGPKPDYVGMDLPSRPGFFRNAPIDVSFAWKSALLNFDTGTVASDFGSGTFSGQSGGYSGRPTVDVSGTFTCRGRVPRPRDRASAGATETHPGVSARGLRASI